MVDAVLCGARPIANTAQLVEDLASGCKPREQWKIGAEHEKFLFWRETLQPVPFDGEGGIEWILEALVRLNPQAEPICEAGRTIGVRLAGGAAVSLEPGGQVELSGAPLRTMHEVGQEMETHLAQLHQVLDPLQIGMLSIGFHPTLRREEVCWVPKKRYTIMRNYMPRKGELGLDMMSRTCTAQVNLDFSSEADMVRKLRLALKLQPIATAMFAHSPFVENRDTGWQSWRSRVWEDTDPDRCGMLPFVFEPGFGFERWVEYVLDTPMYFVRREGRYIDCAGQSFRDFLRGELPALPGELPDMDDWADQLTVNFPEVRLKHFIEMRGADAGSTNRSIVVAAFWTGLLYDAGSLDAAWDLVADWSVPEIEGLRRDVPRQGLHTQFRGRQAGEWAGELIAIARAGLRARGMLDAQGRDESYFLDELEDDIGRMQSPADRLLALYQGSWQGQLSPLFAEVAL